MEAKDSCHELRAWLLASSHRLSWTSVTLHLYHVNQAPLNRHSGQKANALSFACVFLLEREYSTRTQNKPITPTMQKSNLQRCQDRLMQQLSPYHSQIDFVALILVYSTTATRSRNTAAPSWSNPYKSWSNLKLLCPCIINLWRNFTQSNLRSEWSVLRLKTSGALRARISSCAPNVSFVLESNKKKMWPSSYRSNHPCSINTYAAPRVTGAFPSSLVQFTPWTSCQLI